jgi:hypothetical protein
MTHCESINTRSGIEWVGDAMHYLLTGVLMAVFFRILNVFLLLFFLVHVYQARSFVQPVQTTLMTVAGLFGTVGGRTEKSISNAIDETKRRFD